MTSRILPKGWQRVPSVVHGGKQFFYVRIIDHTMKYSIVWDRLHEAYAVEKEDMGKFHSLVLIGYTDNPTLAMKTLNEKVILE
ncbi:MAG: hypothetical protein ACREJN_21545 [Nitrospiraceae bacterium]